ncbi:polysaccharide biosynthesis/export family protein [Synechococcus sp. 8F6]|uniref:polysaccharide biosynthesis/export family protein n=1 Tax=Synechococcus sp. 8F6 TaxID=2025606 RepID=UPI001E5AEE84|nr:polysaccharide biosynthesis/export family protein [Synechococcus sp. 8F6]
MTLALAALQAPLAWAGPTQGSSPATSSSARARVTYNAYILGPGDTLQVELLDIPELSGVFTIGPDGTMYLPRLRALYVEGLTVEELRYFLTEQFRAYVKNPEIYLRPVGYRPIRIYVGGEVRRPGYYTLSGSQELGSLSSAAEASQLAAGTATAETRPGLNQVPGAASGNGIGFAGGGISTFGALFPTVFDAIRTAQGITPYSDLATVQVTRQQALSSGGGRIRTQLNFLTLITEGDESQNIRLFDGDVVSVGKSPVVLRDQLLKAGQTNLSPQFLQVYVSGRVKTPGGVTLPQGSSLNQALNLAGGPSLLRGKVEFIRFTREGELDRRQFAYNPNAPSDAPANPILMAGDIIRVQESALSAGISVMNEITGPIVGIYAVYSLFRGFR